MTGGSGYRSWKGRIHGCGNDLVWKQLLTASSAMRIKGGGPRRKVVTLIAGALLAVASPTAGAQPLGDEGLFVWGVSAHAEWKVHEGRFVTRYAAHAVRFVSDVYPGEVHTDVGVLRRRCRMVTFKAGGCEFRPKDGVDENVEILWDPSLSEVTLNFTFRDHDHAVQWRGHGDHDVRPTVHQPPGLVGVSAYVVRSATATGSIYADRVKANNVVKGETYMWEGGFTWKWVSSP